MSVADGELYHPQLIDLLQEVWGAGWLSPGGPAELALLVAGIDVAGATVLDIGCGAGGVDAELVRTHRAGFVLGIDVEDAVLAAARRHAAREGATSRTGFVKVVPGPLPFPPGAFDIVVSKDSIVHIPDKAALMREVFRVLRPGGRFVASDWLIGHDGPMSPEMAAYVAAEGLDFGMASPARYRAALQAAGFEAISTESRNAWYRQQARAELARMRSPDFADAAARIGVEFVARNIAVWERMLPVLDSGEHCPTHLHARKPGP